MEPTSSHPLPLFLGKASTRPMRFQRLSRTVCHAPYQCISPLRETNTGDGGVLRSGEIIWLESHKIDVRRKRVLAYVDGIGLISLNWRDLA